jgi:hypothetical protein
MQIRWKLLAALLLMAMPLSAQSSKARYLLDADRRCRATLGDGTTYEVWNCVLLTEWEARPLYVKVRAYYRPDSGEFLSWNTGGLSEHGHASELKENPPKAGLPVNCPIITSCC